VIPERLIAGSPRVRAKGKVLEGEKDVGLVLKGTRANNRKWYPEAENKVHTAKTGL